MKCTATKANGKKCKANALRGGKYCYRHSDSMRERALGASSAGGRARRQYHYLGPQVELNTPQDIKKLMGRALNSLWTGKMSSSNPAGSIGYLAKIFLDAYDKGELESRIDGLEKRLDKAKL